MAQRAGASPTPADTALTGAAAAVADQLADAGIRLHPGERAELQDLVDAGRADALTDAVRRTARSGGRSWPSVVAALASVRPATPARSAADSDGRYDQLMRSHMNRALQRVGDLPDLDGDETTQARDTDATPTRHRRLAQFRETPPLKEHHDQSHHQSTTR